MRPSSPPAPPRLRTIILSLLACCFLTPMANAQSASSLSSATTGSGNTVDVWAQRRERAGSFGAQWADFALVQKSWVTKWQKAHGKLTAHIDRCHDEVRNANRDTLLPVTLQCYRGQLLLERDALTNEREVINLWPGIPVESKATMLQTIDGLLSAIQPVVDAIDAKVFTTLDAFQDVRTNLRTQYRASYWLVSARFRADAALTWLNALLISIHTLTQEGTFEPAVQEKILSALQCYETAEPLLAAASSAETLEASRKKFSEAGALLSPCAALLTEAQTLAPQSSSSLSSETQ
ncbi:MAG: hypothetical protein PHN33_04600 [Candidatus Peribacteraceae bacterium]|nr:hypothetical protein [Candidatus Peribacteraceae bacterium]